jgi:hypothetical protein
MFTCFLERLLPRQGLFTSTVGPPSSFYHHLTCPEDEETFQFENPPILYFILALSKNVVLLKELPVWNAERT